MESDVNRRDMEPPHVVFNDSIQIHYFHCEQYAMQWLVLHAIKIANLLFIPNRAGDNCHDGSKFNKVSYLMKSDFMLSGLPSNHFDWQKLNLLSNCLTSINMTCWTLLAIMTDKRTLDKYFAMLFRCLEAAKLSMSHEIQLVHPLTWTAVPGCTESESAYIAHLLAGRFDHYRVLCAYVSDWDTTTSLVCKDMPHGIVRPTEKAILMDLGKFVRLLATNVSSDMFFNISCAGKAHTESQYLPSGNKTFCSTKRITKNERFSKAYMKHDVVTCGYQATNLVLTIQII
jgi:hypothetical protein